MDKKTPKSKKTPVKVVEIKAVPGPNDILSPESDGGKVEKLAKILDGNKILILSLMDEKIPAMVVGIKGNTRKVQQYNPFAVTGPKEPIVQMNLADVYAIDYVVEPSYIKMPNSKKRWMEELSKNKIYHGKKKYWENMGVCYIIDYDLNAINKALQEER